jgi:hypothetical protein
MLSAFLTFMNVNKTKNPMDKIYGNIQKMNTDQHINLTLKNIFRREK